MILLIEGCCEQILPSWWKSWNPHLESFIVAAMTVAKYRCHKWFRKCFIGRILNPVDSSFMTYHRIWNKNKRTGVTCLLCLLFQIILIHPQYLVELVLLNLLFIVRCLVHHCLLIFFLVISFSVRFTISDHPFSYLQTVHIVVNTTILWWSWGWFYGYLCS